MKKQANKRSRDIIHGTSLHMLPSSDQGFILIQYQRPLSMPEENLKSTCRDVPCMFYPYFTCLPVFSYYHSYLTICSIIFILVIIIFEFQETTFSAQ